MDTFSVLCEKVIKDCGATDEQKEFVEKRAMGAKKIQHSAEAKGGPALLTAMHFKAKEIPYRESIKHLGDQPFIKQKAKDCLRKLSNWDKMSQREFQTVMGQLEVYGEIFIKMK